MLDTLRCSVTTLYSLKERIIIKKIRRHKHNSRLNDWLGDILKWWYCNNSQFQLVLWSTSSPAIFRSSIALSLNIKNSIHYYITWSFSFQLTNKFAILSSSFKCWFVIVFLNNFFPWNLIFLCLRSCNFLFLYFSLALCL